MAKKEMAGQGSIVQLEKDKPKGKCRKWQLRVSLGLGVSATVKPTILASVL